MLADEDYLAQCQAQGLYPVSYYPHNLHFLWAAATLEGRSAAAVDAARRVAAKVPHHHAGALAWTADFPVTPLLAYARFGRWKDMLTEPSPPEHEPYAHRHLALCARARIRCRPSARSRPMPSSPTRRRRWRTRHSATTLKDLPLLTNLQIASRIADGELAARRGQTDEAVRLLEEAIAIEDAIPYNEPPVWHHPPRQVLGRSARGSRASARRGVDLSRGPEALSRERLVAVRAAQALEAQGRIAEAAAVRQRFAKAWARADIELTSSRILSQRRSYDATGK